MHFYTDFRKGHVQTTTSQLVYFSKENRKKNDTVNLLQLEIIKHFHRLLLLKKNKLQNSCPIVLIKKAFQSVWWFFVEV